MSSELDKRLDLDLDTVLESPKLRLQLSPAELDKQLLDFYNDVIQGTSGDLLRVISGGKNVGMQNLYMKMQAQRELRRKRKGLAYDESAFFMPPPPSSQDDADDDDITTSEQERTPTESVSMALRRNLPLKRDVSLSSKKTTPKNESTTKMSMMSMPLPIAKLPKRQWTGSPLI